MKKLLALFFCSLFSFFTQAQDQVYYTGHSLVGLDMPFQVRQIAKLKGVATNYRNHINIGTALKENWLDTSFNLNDVWDPELMINYEHGSNHLADLPTISFEHIVITESVPLLGNNRDTTVKYATNFFHLAETGNPAIRKYIYATWEHADAGWPMWRATIASLQTEWEDIADKCAAVMSDNVFIVPGNIAMMALYDTLQVGPVGDKISINQFFNDDIHLNFEGNYYMACLILAVVYHIDPRSTDIIQAGPYTSDSVVFNSTVRATLQELAWQTACKYARSGLDCSAPTGITENMTIAATSVFPNPVTYDHLTIQSINTDEYRLYNMGGRLLLKGTIHKGKNYIDCTGLPRGIYLLKTSTQAHKISLL